MSNTVIKVENLGKLYRLGTVGTGTLSHDLNRWWHRIRGKEDPYLKIGDINDRTTKGKSEYVWALKDINFEVKQGEVLGIIGKNGAGKSTLLKILSQVTKPTVGEVKVRGRIAGLLEVGTGFHPELTGRENIFLNGAILGMTKAEIRRKFDEIVDFSGVERYIDTPVKRYSSGMYVRLAFAVAAHLDPDILIVDEVLAVGDAEFQKKCLGKMKDVSKEGRTVLFVSHDLANMKVLCTRGILLQGGLSVKMGSIKECIDEYLYKDFKFDLLGSTFCRDSNYKSDFKLSAAKLMDFKGNVKSSFSIFEDIIIRLEIEATRYIPGIYGYLAIRNLEGDVFIESDTYDFMPNVLEDYSIGLNLYELKIDSLVLPVGKYSVYLNFTSGLHDRWNVDSPGDILSFEVYDLETKRGRNRKAKTGYIVKWNKHAK